MNNSFQKIFIDTNVLLHCFNWKIRLQEQIESLVTTNYEILVHQLVHDEITQIQKSRNSSKTVKFVLKLIETYNLYDDAQNYPDTDTALLETAKRERGVILTFDKNLMNRCKSAAVPVLYSGKKKLTLIGYIES